MQITIQEENYKELVQCVYLGNLIINEYRKEKEVKKEYIDFIENIFMQVVKAMPKTPTRFTFKNFPNEKSRLNFFIDISAAIC